MQSQSIIKESSPHLRRKDTLASMMIDVLVALLPVTVFALVVFQLDALRILLISIVVMELSEFVFVMVKNKMPYDVAKHPFAEKFKYSISHYTINNFLVPLVSAVIYSLILPASASWYAVAVGALAGIVLGKLVFGGTGYNLFNPAAVGMIVAKLCFGSKWTYSSTSYFDVISSSSTVTTGATALGFTSTYGYQDIGVYSPLSLLLGQCPGTIGETCKICILVGLVYLLVRKAADWRVVATYILTFALLMLIAGFCYMPTVLTSYPSSGYTAWNFLVFELLSGGFLFGAVFMITDPVTMPITTPGRVIYAMIAAVAAVFIRLFASLPEGVGFGILIANMFAPVLDYPQWSSEHFKWQHWLTVGLLFALPSLIMSLAILYGGK